MPANPKSYDITPWVDLSVKSRGKRIRKLPEQVKTSSGSDLYNQIANATGLSMDRLRITSIDDPKQVIPQNLQALPKLSGVEVKDLGPQIAWRTVFVIEYLGPLLIHPLVYYLRPFIYRGMAGTTDEPSYAQWLSMLLISAHFAKREFETLFVHRFSLATMPALNIFKNSAHYWLLGGANIALWTYAPNATAASVTAPTPLLLAGVALFIVGELGNLVTHLQLRALRPEGTTLRQIPRGLGFGLVTCPNYMFEMIAWVGIGLVSLSWSTALFTGVAAAQMAAWAWKKEKRLRKEFGDKYKKKRYAMLPGFI
jgi:very-long-chain enoyl-CoA reductase